MCSNNLIVWLDDTTALEIIIDGTDFSLVKYENGKCVFDNNCVFSSIEDATEQRNKIQKAWEDEYNDVDW